MLFRKNHSVAKSRQKGVSGFLTVKAFFVQTFSTPITSLKTVNGSLQTSELLTKYFAFLIDMENDGFRHPFPIEELMYKNNASLNTKVQTEIWLSVTTKSRSKLCSRKILHPPIDRN